MSNFYDDKYRTEELYWGKQPSSIARLLFHRYPPQEHQTLLDIGCGEGRDSLFFARNGYRVTGFDYSAEGVRKAMSMAEEQGVMIDFFQADINEYRVHDPYDVIFASGTLHYIPPRLREETISNYKQFTTPGGLHAVTVPVEKAFLPKDPESDVLAYTWRSGEILTHYHDWKIEFFAESILENVSEYKFPVNRLIAREPSVFVESFDRIPPNQPESH